jgi:hypothetical protein
VWNRPCDGLLVAVLLSGCGAVAASVEPPATTLAAYEAAIRANDVETAYALLDERTKREVTLGEFRSLAEANRAELTEQAEELARAAEHVPAIAHVPLEDGETVQLVLEDGRWAIEGGVLDAPALRTPEEAVLSLRRALSRRSLPGIERILARVPRAEMEAERERILEETADDLDYDVEVQGNRAVVRLTGGREIELVREAGEWRVLEIR